MLGPTVSSSANHRCRRLAGGTVSLVPDGLIFWPAAARLMTHVTTVCEHSYSAMGTVPPSGRLATLAPRENKSDRRKLARGLARGGGCAHGDRAHQRDAGACEAGVNIDGYSRSGGGGNLNHPFAALPVTRSGVPDGAMKPESDSEVVLSPCNSVATGSAPPSGVVEECHFEIAFDHDAPFRCSSSVLRS